MNALTGFLLGNLSLAYKQYDIPMPEANGVRARGTGHSGGHKGAMAKRVAKARKARKFRKCQQKALRG